MCAPALHSGSTAPTMLLVNRRGIVWGAKAKPPVLRLFPAALLCSARVARKCVYVGPCELVTDCEPQAHAATGR